ncbi:Nucleoside-diphosphate-sugar epimerase [Streptomyces misionensis]|uniref:Nucleoside-diphosphate-sugar epimerase n=1 Tax=Streptomyces misionensis TaxID=67331 RepID=A0A1H4IAT0_9ACTN|nr:SDR family oxidoreductase [Streptomyces misionensis]SEB31040.1 Nucleoside-diphosphate-sugar epimerase [Streptomyces misionensis]
MQIVGNGFLARHFARLADRHDGVVLLAAGVSWAAGTSAAAFAREEALVREVLRRCRADGTRLVFFSTASTGMYGAPGCHGREDELVTPCTPYGRHKRALEQVVGSGGADHLVLRLGHVVGPGHPPHQLLPSLISQVRAGEVTVHRGAARDLIAIDDVVDLVDRLLTLGVRDDVVNIASGVAVPVEAIVDHLERRLGTPATRRFVTGLGANHRVRIDKLRRLLHPRPVAFADDYYQGVLDRYVDSPATAQEAPAL